MGKLDTNNFPICADGKGEEKKIMTKSKGGQPQRAESSRCFPLWVNHAGENISVRAVIRRRLRLYE